MEYTMLYAFVNVAFTSLSSFYINFPTSIFAPGRIIQKSCSSQKNGPHYNSFLQLKAFLNVFVFIYLFDFHSRHFVLYSIGGNPHWAKELSFFHTANDGRWKSNINVWFRLMYSQTWNCAASLFPKQNYNVLSPNFLIMYLWAIYIFPGSVCLFAAPK